MTRSDRTLNEWVEGFAKLYNVPDSMREPEHLWIGAMAHFSAVGEAIRQYDFLEIHKASAHAFCWLLCFANKLHNTDDPLFMIKEPIWRLVGFKYPKVCGHCMVDACICSPKERESKKEKEFLYKDWLDRLNDVEGELKTKSIRQWMDMFYNIYGKNTDLRRLDSIGFHLLEEGGEEAKAVRSLTQFSGIVHDSSIKLEADFLKLISNLNELVEWHSKLTDKLKKVNNLENSSEVKEYIRKNLHSRESTLIEWRIVTTKLDLVSEYCDAFSWLCTLLDKCKHIQNNLELSNKKDIKKWDIEHILSNIYKSKTANVKLKCYACHKESCKCLIFDRKHQAIPPLNIH